MTQKDKNTHKSGQTNRNKTAREQKKERLANSLRENLLRRKQREKHGDKSMVSDTI